MNTAPQPPPVYYRGYEWWKQNDTVKQTLIVDSLNQSSTIFVALMNEDGVLFPIAGFDATGNWFNNWTAPMSSEIPATETPSWAMPRGWYAVSPRSPKNIRGVALLSMALFQQQCGVNWGFLTNVSSPRANGSDLGAGGEIALSVPHTLLDSSELAPYDSLLKQTLARYGYVDHNEIGETAPPRFIFIGAFQSMEDIVVIGDGAGYESSTIMIFVLRAGRGFRMLTVEAGGC